MLFQVLSITLITAGCLTMCLTTWRYYNLMIYILQETYSTQKSNKGMLYANFFMMLLFIFGFFVGAADMLTRQVEPIYNFVVVIFFLGALYIYGAVDNQVRMAKTLRQKTLETMKTFVNAIDMKDSYTKGHSEHVYHIVKLFFQFLPESYRRQLNYPKLLDAALLHDIGKISIQDAILNKKGELTEEEWAIIHTHPKNGKKMLDDTCFKDISLWVLYHHERMDGNGYYGIKPEDIPLESRIIAIADTYSALCTDRSYRKKMSHSDAMEIMKAASGDQLDPELFRLFIKIPTHNLQKLLKEL